MSERLVSRRKFLSIGLRAAALGLGTAAVSTGTGLMIGPPMRRFFQSLEAGEFDLAADQLKAQQIEDKKGDQVTNPIARFNLSLNGQNPDFHSKTGHRYEHLQPVDVHQELSEDPETGQKLNTLFVNWGTFRPDQPVILLSPSYNNAIEEGATFERIKEMSRVTGLPLIAFDYPEVGKSDPLTKTQLKDLKRLKGFKSIAAPMLRIMSDLGISNVYGTAQSMGAYVQAEIAGLAPQFGIEFKKMFLVEPPAGEFEFFDFMQRFLASGGLLDLYQSRPYDPNLRIAAGLTLHPITKGAKDLLWAMSTLFKDPHYVYARNLARNQLGVNLARALKSNPSLVVGIGQGGDSLICIPQELLTIIDNLKSVGFEGRVFRKLFPGEGHIALEHPKRYAGMADIFFRS